MAPKAAKPPAAQTEQQASPPRVPAALHIAAWAALHVAAALVFSRGFLLTRLELPGVSQCPGPGCGAAAAARAAGGGGGRWAAAAAQHGQQERMQQQQQPMQKQQHAVYDRAVVLIIDALRYDFVCERPGPEKPHAGAFPRTMALVADAADAAVALRFVADTPTITMSRLKALLTGGLPTFLDVGSSFSAPRLSEDNLLSQLLAAGARAAFAGDDTWQQLAPTEGAFDPSWPFPSFNVKDLHTVDDGVWAHVLPLLRGRGVGPAPPPPWDVLVGHYLGADHAGHSHGVRSRQMAAKLAQMDAQAATVLELVADGAGPGGPYERALVLILSDHGQTLGGDHGGGTPDEADTVLVAAGAARLRRRLLEARARRRQAQGQGAEATPRLLSEADLDTRQEGLLSAAWGASFDGAQPSQQQQQQGGSNSSGDSSSSDGDSDSGAEPACQGSIAQIDLTPTLALLLGVPIPYGNLGCVPRVLWDALAPPATSGDSSSDGSSSGFSGSASYAAALAANAAQVHRYLNAYAAAGRLPAAPLARANALHAAAEEVAARSGGDSNSEAAAWGAFLDAAAALARAQFTQFHGGFIWAGVLSMAIVVALHARASWRALQSARLGSGGGGGGAVAASRECLILAGLQAAGAAALFSVGALMGEGRIACAAADAAALVLGSSALAAARRAAAPPPGRGGAAAAAARCVGLIVVLVAANHAMQAIGLIDRSGKDPHDKSEPTVELLRPSGGDGSSGQASAQAARHLAATLAPIAATWLLWVACGAWLRAQERKRGSYSSSSSKDAGASAALFAIATSRAAATLEAGAAAAFWWAQLTGAGDAPASVLIARSAASAQLPASLVAAALRVVPPFVLEWLSLPVRLLLPRAVYAMALFALAVSLSTAAAAAVQRRRAGASGNAAAARSARATLWLAAALMAPVTMSLGYKGPALSFLATAQTAALAALLAARRGALLSLSKPASGDAAADDDYALAAALALGAHALQLFFVAGHFCEFSGLQYAASFVGFDDMAPLAGGALLLANTFGLTALACLVLPVVIAALGDDGDASATSRGGVKEGSKSRAAASRHKQSEPASAAAAAAARARFAGAALAVGAGRALALGVAMASAGVQQGHILLWAIFAPKLVFEMWLCAVADAFLLLGALTWHGW